MEIDKTLDSMDGQRRTWGCLMDVKLRLRNWPLRVDVENDIMKMPGTICTIPPRHTKCPFAHFSWHKLDMLWTCEVRSFSSWHVPHGQVERKERPILDCSVFRAVYQDKVLMCLVDASEEGWKRFSALSTILACRMHPVICWLMGSSEYLRLALRTV